MPLKAFPISLSLLPFLAACSFNVATPPARTAFFGSPRILPAGESAVTGEGTVAAELFGPSLTGGSLTYERGLGDLREIVVTPTGGAVQTESPYLGLSVDMKQGLPNEPLLAFTYGGGYFWNAHGQAVSGEAGILAGYENRYFVPTLSMMVFLDQPFGTETICVDPSENGDKVCAKPTLTLGARLGLTGEIKLPWRVSLIPSVALLPIQSKTHSFLMEQASAALRWEFR